MSVIKNKRNIREKENAKEIVREYWTDRSEDFAKLKKEELHSAKYDRWETMLCHYLPQRQGLNILDVGCGCGFFSIMLSRMGHQVVGIDLTEAMIEQGKILAKQEGAEVSFQVMDAEKLDFSDQSFDVVISRNLTWTLPHPKEAYREWFRVLKKDGILLNFDGEYAKDHHQRTDPLPQDHAHNMLTEKQKENCHHIYHMMEISLESRPAWDVQTLQQIGAEGCEIEFGIDEKIFKEKDKFYVSANMFAVKAWK